MGGERRQLVVLVAVAGDFLRRLFAVTRQSGACPAAKKFRQTSTDSDFGFFFFFFWFFGSLLETDPEPMGK